jgi:hypothetical protein
MPYLPSNAARGVLVTAAVAFAAAAGCSGSSGPSSERFHFSFDESLEGWTVGFADYPAGTSDPEQQAIDEFYELDGGHARLPEPLDTRDGAVMLTGNNHSDDLFMFLKRRVGGLAPDTAYQLELRTVFATDVPRGCVGVGGSPGEGVFVKGGATGIEPLRVSDDASGHRVWIMNIDKDEQAVGGTDAVVLGDFANSKDCDSADFSYELKELSNLALPAFSITTDANGEAWILLGTDSGFESTTTIYDTEIEAIFVD